MRYADPTDNNSDSSPGGGPYESPEDKACGPDTEYVNVCEAVQSLVNEVGRHQGGTNSVFVDGSKGNDDKIPTEPSERVNSDPQGHSWDNSSVREVMGDDHEGLGNWREDGKGY